MSMDLSFVSQEEFALHLGGSGNGFQLADHFPFKANKPVLFVRNNHTEDRDVQVQSSDDEETWTVEATVSVVARGREIVTFTTDKKFVRFVVDKDSGEGVFGTVCFFGANAARLAGV